MATLAQALTPDDLLVAVAVNQAALTPVVDHDWSVLAGTLEWDCRKTLDHLIDGSIFYSGQVSNLATTRRPRIRAGDPKALITDLLPTVDTVGHILASVLRSAPSDGRFFHPAGMADTSGYVGMACVELLAHTFDISRGLGVAFQPPQELCDRILRRLFPWIKDTAPDTWATLCWATGRLPLAGREEVEPDWYWQCAPLEEWDGKVRKRTPSPEPR